MMLTPRARLAAATLAALLFGLLGTTRASAKLKYVTEIEEPGTHKPLPKPTTGTRLTFSYSDKGVQGVFLVDDKNQWCELTGPPGATFDHGDLKYHLYTVSRQTPLYLDLLDASRSVTVRLYDNACYTKSAGTEGKWVFLHAGKWSQPPK